ncbi:pilus assembly protein TadG-related protein [Ornithinibacillus sp. FSL M8-0202]|uniref:pilus assembly protein TadG-related protein n=1 Tax=Ornithinibacillus sp. FSL M8-0202 TaxID=2921616 RepID=UPI0030CE8575
MKRLIEFSRDERGNMALFVLGMLGIMMVLFVFVINLSSVLVTKEKSNTTVSQASLAASSAFYEEVRNTITSYSYPQPTPPTQPDDDADDEAFDEYEDKLEDYYEKLEVYKFFSEFEEIIEDKMSSLTGLSYYNWSNQEKKLQALDLVLEEALTNEGLLQEIVEELLVGNNEIHNATIQMAILTIEKNGGVLDGATLNIEDNRIIIKAANETTETSYDSFMSGMTEKLYQESAGPVIDFISLIWTKNTPVYLEYE